MNLTHRCLICHEEHIETGQQTRSSWQITTGAGNVICRRCCAAGKAARKLEANPAQPVPPDLRTLIETWRNRVAGENNGEPVGYIEALTACADELEAALEAGPRT